MPKLIDIHAHINFRDFREDGDEVIKRALEKDVWLINVGSQYSTSQRAIEYAEKYKRGVYAAVGLHPIHLIEQSYETEVAGKKTKITTRAEEFDVEKYRELALNQKVVAIGEIGLDYYWISDEWLKENPAPEGRGSLNEIERQKDIFKKQLQLAYELKKPVIIHCRDPKPNSARGFRIANLAIRKPSTRGRSAHQDVIEILEEFLKDKTDFKGGTIHCFSGNWQDAQKYFQLGFHISFTGLITFVHNWDDIIKKAPLEKLMAETDCPYMTPAPFRGKRNEPIYVEFVVRRIAELKGISFEEAAKATTENALKLFNIPG